MSEQTDKAFKKLVLKLLVRIMWRVYMTNLVVRDGQQYREDAALVDETNKFLGEL